MKKEAKNKNVRQTIEKKKRRSGVRKQKWAGKEMKCKKKVTKTMSVSNRPLGIFSISIAAFNEK